MAHTHTIVDAETHFVINATTREISNADELPALVQNDHNSERFTFVIPRYVDGHDMSICNKPRVHYLNIDSATKKQYADVYEIDDLHIDEADETKVVCTWLISRYATQYAGPLNFIIQYACEENGVIGYSWNTAIFKGITVKNGINNAELIMTEYTDILEKWKQEILESVGQGGTGGGGSGLTEEQAANLAANTEARHTHTPSNKAALDKFEVGTVPYGAYPFYNGQPLAFLDDIGSGSGSNHEHTHYLEKTSNLHVLNKFSQTKESDSDSYRPMYETSPLAFKKELTTPLESQDDIEKAIYSPDTLTTKLWALNAAGLKRYHDTFVTPLSGGNGETTHSHVNKDVLDYFGINYTGTRPTFKGNSNGLINILATQDDIITRVNKAKSDLEAQITSIPKFSIEVVDTLPETDISGTTVYLLRDTETDGNLYTEYIYINDEWECLGSQNVDLTGYYTKKEIDDKGFITAEDIPDIPEGDFSQFIEQTADSVNLYPPMVEGWTDNASLKSDGSENPTASGAYCITPPISVLPNTTYTVKPIPWGGLTDANRGRAYSENGTALAKLVWVENADGTIGFTTPENASYVRFTVYKTNFDNSNSNITDIDIIIPIFNSVFMLVKGTTAPEEYEAFGEGKYRLKDIEIPEKSVSLSKVGDESLPIFAPLAGKKIVNFGDSIFGNARPPEDVSTFLAKKTGAEVFNCAFGGCRMAIHTGHWDAFSMYRLAYSIANNDFALQDEAINYDDRTSYAEEPLALIKATDFSNIDIVTIGYGTNDFTGNNTLDNSENPLDTSTVGGALRYSIEQLLTSYPNLRIFVLSTMYRFYIDNNNEFTEDSNTKVNSIGLKLSDYNAKLKEVAEEYNLPFIDNYNIGIGKFNRYQYFNANDGTHHNENGRKLIASHLAKELY